jgi:hypothetical protein
MLSVENGQNETVLNLLIGKRRWICQKPVLTMSGPQAGVGRVTPEIWLDYQNSQ